MKYDFFSNIFTIMILSQIKLDVNKKPTFYYSTFFTKEKYNVTYEELLMRLTDLYFKDLNIFVLNEALEKDLERLPQIKGRNTDSTLVLYKVKPGYFFSSEFMQKLINYTVKNPETMIVLFYEGYSIRVIRTAFMSRGISISGGNNTLKHILSPQQHLLSKIITLIYGWNNDLVTKSFLELTRNKELSRAFVSFTSEKGKQLLDQLKKSQIEGESEKSKNNLNQTHTEVFEKKIKIVNTNNNFNGTQKRDFHTNPSLKKYTGKESKINTPSHNFESIGCFSNIKEFLESNPINIKTQEELEYLLYHKSVKFNKDGWNDFLEFPSELRVNILSLIPLWEEHLTDLKTRLEKNKAIKNKVDFYNMTDLDKKKFLFLEIINYLKKDENNKTDLSKTPENSDSIHNISTRLKNEKIIGKILLCLLTIIKYSDSEEPDSYDIKTSVKASSLRIGKEVALLVLSYLFKEQDEFKSLSLFRAKQNDEKFKLLLDENFLYYIGEKLINVLISSGALDTTVLTKKDKRYTFLKISSKPLLKHKNKTLVTPIKLPMIIKPKEYSKHSLGGYLLNDKLFIDYLINKRPTDYQIENINSIYHTVNELSSTPFRVNTEVLDFILANSKEFLNEKQELDILDKKGFLNWRDSMKYKSLLSVKILKENIIGIALCYRNIPNFYFPVKLDYTSGKIRVIPQDFHLQSHEMAKSLLLLSNPVTILKTDEKTIEFYKVMAANYFGNGGEKASFDDKLTWFMKNEMDIINYDNHKLLNKAKNKFLFLAFCIEYKKLYSIFMGSDKESFNSYLPIQADAAFNGFKDITSKYIEEKKLVNNIRTKELKTNSVNNTNIDLLSENLVKNPYRLTKKGIVKDWVQSSNSVLTNWTQKLLDLIFSIIVVLTSTILYLILKEDVFDMKSFSNPLKFDYDFNRVWDPYYDTSWMWKINYDFSSTWDTELKSSWTPDTELKYSWTSDTKIKPSWTSNTEHKSSWISNNLHKSSWMWDFDNNLHWMLEHFDNPNWVKKSTTGVLTREEKYVEINNCEIDNYSNRNINIVKQKGKFYGLLDINNYFNNNIKTGTIMNHYDKNNNAADYNAVAGTDKSIGIVVNERPQVLSSVLKHHLDIANQDISLLNDKISAYEIFRIKDQIKIHDTASMCRRVLTGIHISGNNSPVGNFINPLQHSSHIVRSNSSINDFSSIKSTTPIHEGIPPQYEGIKMKENISNYNSFTENASSSTDVYNSSIKNKTPILKSHSPYIRSSSPFMRAESPLRSSSPFMGTDSPIRSSSPFMGTDSPIRASSPFVRPSSPFMGTDSPIRSSSPFVRPSSPFIRTESPLTKAYRFLGNKSEVSYSPNLDIISDYSPSRMYKPDLNVDKPSLREDSTNLNEISPLNPRICITPISNEYPVNNLDKHHQDTILDKYNMFSNNKDYLTTSSDKVYTDKGKKPVGQTVRKYPIREVESTYVLKRYGNYWANYFNVESPSTIKRYGWISPAGTSVLEEHSPLAKRFGHVFPEEFTLKKDYHVITEHNNTYKAYGPYSEEQKDWDEKNEYIKAQENFTRAERWKWWDEYTKANDAERLNDVDNLSKWKDILNKQEKSYENWKLTEELAQKKDKAEMEELLNKVYSRSSSPGSDITIKGNNAQSSRSSSSG